MTSNTLLQSLIAPPAVTRRIYTTANCAGLEPRAMQVLIAVQLLQRPTVKEVALELELAQRTVSAMLVKLHELGLVESSSDPTDRRQQLQTVTERGCAMIDTFAHAARAVLDTGQR